MDIEQFFRELVEESGDRPSYLIEERLAREFISSGATINSEIDNKDGTFFTSMGYQGKTLICISTEKIPVP